jgi:pantetheine-phosphate adenylyltransferase
MPTPKLRVAVYAGTFDPLTNGHLNIITRAAKLYDKLIIAVSDHGRKRSKKPAFTAEERCDAINKACAKLKNVSTDTFTGLLKDLMEKHQATVAIRGLRATSDFEYEFQIAAMNRYLSDQFETVLMMAEGKYTYISSTIVREAAGMGADVSGLVPPACLPMIKRVYGHK